MYGHKGHVSMIFCITVILVFILQADFIYIGSIIRLAMHRERRRWLCIQGRQVTLLYLTALVGSCNNVAVRLQDFLVFCLCPDSVDIWFPSDLNPK